MQAERETKGAALADGDVELLTIGFILPVMERQSGMSAITMGSWQSDGTRLVI